jgi:hypothetical protein
MLTFFISQDSLVGIATGYGLDDRVVGVRVPVGSRIFSTSSGPALGSTQPPIEWVPGPLSPGIKRPGSEADHSPPTSAELNKIWIYTSTPHTPSWRSAMLSTGTTLPYEYFPCISLIMFKYQRNNFLLVHHS